MTRELKYALKNSNLGGHSNRTNKSDPRGRMCFHLVCVKSGCKCCQKVHFCKKMLGRETRANSAQQSQLNRVAVPLGNCVLLACTELALGSKGSSGKQNMPSKHF